jgi:hypothetical protein
MHNQPMDLRTKKECQFPATESHENDAETNTNLVGVHVDDAAAAAAQVAHEAELVARDHAVLRNERAMRRG